MSGPTLALLREALPRDLVPYPAGRAVPATPVTAVHVSELPDPTRYLEGGELLLTTGLTAVPTLAWFRAYLARLRDAGVAGLALGLGPRFAAVPPGFAGAVDEVDLPVFVVPAETTFLSISRRYWEMAARPFTDALAGHRALLEAANAPDPEAAVIRRLAGAGAGGWAAHLSRDGTPLTVHPRTARAYAQRMRDEVARLAAAGVRAATLPVDDQVVMLHPLVDHAGPAVAGYVAIGSTGPLPPDRRHLMLAGVAVLGASLNHRRELRTASLGARTPILRLLLGGATEAARALADLILPRLLTDPHRPAVVTAPTTVVAELAAAAVTDDRCVVAWADRRTLRLLLTNTDSPAEWLAGLVRDTDEAAGAIGTAVPFDLLPDAYDLLAARAATGDAGTLADLHAAAGSLLARLKPTAVTAWARRLLTPVLAYDRADLTPALAAYLRHRGGWDAAARELGVHRHTLRHRVRRAEELLGVDLSDVDTTAELWLALRHLGLA